MDLTKTLDIIKAYEPPEGYFLAFSGGKDSCVLKALADMAGVSYDAHYNNTGIDPPELVQFIKKEHPDVIFDVPRYSDGTRCTMWNLIVKKVMPPTRRVRYCCQYLKEFNGKNRLIMTGVRWAESPNRRKKREMMEGFEAINLMNDNAENRKVVEICGVKAKRVLNPIIDWTNEDVWSFLKEYKIPYCSLYDEGFTRLGCIGCPLAGKKRIKEFRRYPQYFQLYLHSIRKMLEARAERNLETTWKNEYEVMEWWLEGELPEFLREGIK